MTVEVTTVDDLRRIEQQYPDKRFELIDGVIVEMPAPSPLHAYISDEIFVAVRAFVRLHNLGHVFSDSVSYTLSDTIELIPDVSFVSYARQPDLPQRFMIAPDLAVEVVSPSNRPREMLDKVERYLRYGSRFVWLVYPEKKIVDVYRLAEDGSIVLRSYGINDTLDGGDVLPGFTLAVKEIFAT